MPKPDDRHGGAVHDARATGTVVLLRHGQSRANADGLFTGLLDVPLTDAGRGEAANAARLLDAARLWPEEWFCSPLRRAVETAQILLDRTPHRPLGVEYDWRLAERNYGALTGLSKAAVLAEHGEQAFRTWRRSVDIAPPPMDEEQRRLIATDRLGATEALRTVIARVEQLWRARILPALRTRGSVLVVAHGNSLRALCAVLDRLDDEEVEELNLPTGQPLVYRLDDHDRPLERGGRYLDPVAASAAALAIAREGGT